MPHAQRTASRGNPARNRSATIGTDLFIERSPQDGAMPLIAGLCYNLSRPGPEVLRAPGAADY